MLDIQDLSYNGIYDFDVVGLLLNGIVASGLRVGTCDILSSLLSELFDSKMKNVLVYGIHPTASIRIQAYLWDRHRQFKDGFDMMM